MRANTRVGRVNSTVPLIDAIRCTYEGNLMNTTTRLHNVQTCMSRTREEAANISPTQLAAWIAELETVQQELTVATSSFRRIAEVNDALRLIAKLFEAAHASRVSGDEVRSLLELMQGWLEQMLDEVRPLYF